MRHSSSRCPGYPVALMWLLLMPVGFLVSGPFTGVAQVIDTPPPENPFSPHPPYHTRQESLNTPSPHPHPSPHRTPLVVHTTEPHFMRPSTTRGNRAPLVSER